MNKHFNNHTESNNDKDNTTQGITMKDAMEKNGGTRHI